MQCLTNLLLNTDSYKASHWLQYPPGTDATFFYVESRGGLYDRTLFYGLQAILKEYLAWPITPADIAEARDVFAAHGEPFNEAGWRSIIDRHGGHMPIRIRAVPEGTVVPTHNALVTIESTDPLAYWVPSYLETMLLRLWYPVTVATISWHIKQTVRQFLERTSDAPAQQLPFKLHDFGSRGVSSAESAALGGSAHLVNFLGTDNVLALMAARAHYHEPMAGFSIPAAEHSTITSWGRENEVEAYRNMLRQFAKPGSLLAVVSDSYDIYHAIREHWGKTLKNEVIASGATLVVRPDSGDPVQVVHQCLVLLDEAFGHTMTGKGYKLLNHVRVIQGDGINPDSIRAILERATGAGYATDNLTFGMGGALLQQLHRDTQKFALKCSAARIDGRWIDVYKEPITDQGKQSKRGRMTLLQHRQLGAFQTVPVPPEAASLADVVKPPGYEDAMVTVWENGQLLREWTFAEVRGRADAARLDEFTRS
ncbi:MAG TPA: nicotinate phosphoribosyltransferase [Steroidobacteraceae bacterium]|nr:nicotinate phosphoribosyltransferase [Steroidobacteraceae bacterium]